MYTFNSLGTHNIYSTISIIGLKQKLKWYKKLSPVSDMYLDVKEAKKRKAAIKDYKENGGQLEYVDSTIKGL